MNASRADRSTIRPRNPLLVVMLLAACASAPVDMAASTRIAIGADHPAIRISGRAESLGTARVTLGWSGSRIRLRFQDASSITIRFDDESGDNFAMAWVDGVAQPKFRLNASDGRYLLASNLAAGEHMIEVVRVTECQLGLTHFLGFELEGGGAPIPWPDAPERRIEFIGDSITCGYGVEVDDPALHFEPATENFCLGYSGLTARQLGADYLVVSRSGIGMLRNYDGPREGSADAMPSVYPYTFYLQRDATWDFHRFTPDVICLNLGTNDFSTSGVDVDAFIHAYHRFLELLLARQPAAQIVMIQGPMNTSPELRAALEQIRSRLPADQGRRVHFLALSPQGGVGFGADHHPNRAQSRINAAELTSFLRELMQWP